MIRVTDTGTGMAPDVLARAFDPFFTTAPIGQGTGLGLSMAYGFARQAGGQIKLSSVEGGAPRYRSVFPAISARWNAGRSSPPRLS